RWRGSSRCGSRGSPRERDAMRTRALLVLLAVAAVAGGGAALGSSHQRPLVTVTPAGAHSGAWLCPHGGGQGWHVELSVTNPGSGPVPVRVTTLAKSGSEAPRRIVVPKASSIRIAVKADTRGAATEVEYFGAWVGVSWIATAGG